MENVWPQGVQVSQPPGISTRVILSGNVISYGCRLAFYFTVTKNEEQCLFIQSILSSFIESQQKKKITYVLKHQKQIKSQFITQIRRQIITKEK